MLFAGTMTPAVIDGIKITGGAPPPFPNPPPPPIFDQLPFSDSELDIHTLTMNWGLNDGHTLTSVTGFIESDDVKGFDPDQGPFALFSVTRFEDYEQWSQELRLTSSEDRPLEYVVGAYFQDSELNFTSLFRQNFFLPPPLALVAQGMSDRDFSQDEQILALFGRVTWNISDTLRLSGGLRYNDVEKDAISILQWFDIDNVSPPSPGTQFLLGNIFGNTPGTTQDSFSDSEVSPEVILEWDVNDGINAYAKYAQGFKAGGFNADFETDPAIAIDFVFKPEDVDSIEVGAKTTLLDGAMFLNLALFRSEYTDLQAAIFDAATTSFVVTNAGEAITQGIEAELNWQATDTLRIDASLGLLDATYDDFPNGPCTASQLEGLASGCIGGLRQELTGEPLNYAPDVSASVRFSYDRPVGNLELHAHLDIKYLDEFDTALDNEPFLRPDSHTKADFGIGIGANSWDVGLVINNLTDEETFRAGGDMPTSNLSYILLPDRPRTVALQANYRW